MVLEKTSIFISCISYERFKRTQMQGGKMLDSKYKQQPVENGKEWWITI